MTLVHGVQRGLVKTFSSHSRMHTCQERGWRKEKDQGHLLVQGNEEIKCFCCLLEGFPDCSVVKNPPDSTGEAGGADWIPGSGRFPGAGNGNCSGILAGIIPWTEEPGRLQPMGWQSQDTTERARMVYFGTNQCKGLWSTSSLPWSRFTYSYLSS